MPSMGRLLTALADAIHVLTLGAGSRRVPYDPYGTQAALSTGIDTQQQLEPAPGEPTLTVYGVGMPSSSWSTSASPRTV
jgi:hypothetical protein